MSFVRFPSSVCVGIGQVSFLGFFLLVRWYFQTQCRQSGRGVTVPTVRVQMLATIVVLWVGKAARVISFPDCDESIPRKVKTAVHL